MHLPNSQAPSKTPVTPNARGFRADIQGLRAIAVGSVVLFHAFGSKLPGGFVGVDIFFVISGYLISGLILAQIARGQFSISDFYRRRIKRIFPALYLMLAVTSISALFILSPRDYAEFAKTAVCTILFISNMEFIRLGGYFAGPSDLKPLLHTWSLAVEEQFYLLYPLLLFALRRIDARRVGVVLVSLALLSLAFSCWETSHDPSKAYFLAPTRFFELLLGGLCALYRIGTNWSRPMSQWIVMAGLACMATAIVFFDSAMPFPGYAAALPCIGAALVIAAGEGGATYFSWLSRNRVILYLGELSFSLYLWHWPVLALQRHWLTGERTVLDALAAIALATLLAAISLRFVERPILRSTTPHRFIRQGLVAMVAGCVIAGAVVLTGGLPQRFPAPARQLFAAYADFNQKRDTCHAGAVAIHYEDNCTWGVGAPRVAVWGDSHGAELSVALGQRTAASGVGVMEITSSACPPALFAKGLDVRCIAHNRDTVARLSADSRISEVVLVADYLDYGGLGVGDVVDGVLVSAAKLAEAGKHVVLVAPIPVFAFDPPTRLGLAASYGLSLDDVGTARAAYDRSAGAIRQRLSESAHGPSFQLIEPNAVLCDDRLCHAYKPGLGALYFNPNHLSIAGARLVADMVELVP